MNYLLRLKFQSKIVFTSLLLLLLLGFHSYAATINVPGDQATIQAAVNAAAAGDVILVADGTYTENVNLATGPAGITIQAVNPSGATVNGGASPAFFADNHTGNIRIEGFVMTAAFVDNASGVLNITNLTGRLTVINNNISSGGDTHGVYHITSGTMETNSSILNNTFGLFGNDDCIHIEAGVLATGGDADIIIDGNSNYSTLGDDAIAVLLSGSNSSTIVVVTNNNFDGWTAAGNGIEIDIAQGTPVATNQNIHFTVDNNTIGDADSDAIFIDLDGINNTVFGDITNNTINGDGADTESGIFVDGDATIDGGVFTLNISNNDISGISDDGIQFYPTGDDPGIVTWNLIIDGNTIDNPNTDMNPTGQEEAGINLADDIGIDDEKYIINAEITNNIITNVNAVTACILIERPTTTTAGTAVVNYELSNNTGCTETLRGNPTVATDPVPASLDLLTIGDLVWEDINGDGLKGGAEPGVEGVSINISGNGFTGKTTSDQNGNYTLPALTPGTYTLTAIPTAALPTITTQNAGGDPTIDSDFDPTTMSVDVTLVAGGTDNLTIDLGVLGSLPPPTITLNPTDQTTCEAVAANFTITADNASSYQWEESTNNGATYAPISDGGAYAGTMTTTLTVTPGAAMNGNLYRCVATGASAPPATSTGAILTIETGEPRFISADPENSLFTIENCGTCSVDLTNYQLCASFSYALLNSGMVVAGSLMLAPGNTVTINWANPAVTGSDLGLYLPGGSFSNPADMVDFTQWGTTGNGRESVAVAKGIWDSATTIDAIGPYSRSDCNLDKVAAWTGVPIMNAASGCTDYTVTGVSGASWINFRDGSDNIVVSINPNGNDLGDVTVQVDDLNSVLQDSDLRYYIPRYFNFEATNYISTMPPTNFNNGPVSMRLYYKNDELSDYNTAKGGSETMNDLNITHYAGTNEDCKLTNNSSLGRTLEFIIPSTAAAYNNSEGFYLEFPLSHFSETGTSSNADGPLPIELQSFEGKAMGNVNELTWTTFSEVGFDRFIVERSKDGSQFRALGPVQGKGGNTINKYSYYDENPLVGENYYRLNMVDEDGSSRYSAIISIKSTKKGDFFIQPNPVSDKLTILFSEKTTAESTLVIFNVTGVMMKKEQLKAGNLEVKFDVSGLAVGTYFIRMEDDKNTETYKFIKL